jgi:hypothetical protein
MGTIYRHQKKEPLTVEEMDGNFANLDERVKALETKTPLGEGIAKITQEGDQLTVHGTLGNILGQVRLPKAFPNAKGKWQPQTVYRVLRCEGGKETKCNLTI